jgi:outer membrane biosynthesis protein TonB
VGARFCAACGARTAAASRPVSWSTAERRYFGLFPGRRFAGTVRGRLQRWFAIARSQVRLAVAVMRSQLRAALETFRLRREVSRLERERSRQLHALGDATYRGDEEQATEVRARLRGVERRMDAVGQQLADVQRRAGERIDHAQMESGPTNIVEPNPAPAPGEPAPPIVPEPEPVPSDPPGPVIVPEPEPVPHEPPGPVIVPEPEPPTGR